MTIPTTAGKPNPVQVLLAGSNPALLKTLRHLIEFEPDLRVTGSAPDHPTIHQLLGETTVDVLLIDYSVTDKSMPEFLWKTSVSYPRIRIVYLTDCIRRGLLLEMYRSGAAGVLLHSSAAARLTDVLRTVTSGRPYLDPQLESLNLERDLPGLAGGVNPIDGLTSTERLIIKLAAEGLPLAQIGDRLALGESATRARWRHLFQKLGVANRGELFALAVASGLIATDNIRHDGNPHAVRRTNPN